MGEITDWYFLPSEANSLPTFAIQVERCYFCSEINKRLVPFLRLVDKLNANFINHWVFSSEAIAFVVFSAPLDRLKKKTYCHPGYVAHKLRGYSYSKKF